MNNIRKFRVWCKTKKEWERDIMLIDGNGKLLTIHNGILRVVNMSTHIVQFSTGIITENNEEIFEGDVVETGYDFTLGYVIRLESGEYGISTKDGVCSDFTYDDWRKFKIVGHRYGE